MNGLLKLAHLSDIHLPPPRPYFGDIRMKRMLGMLNWYAGRHRQHLASTLSAIVADMRSQAPDHIAVTGDLVNVGLPFEHEAASRWLATLGSPAHVTAIPGNHDIYVDMPADQGIGVWQAFMADDEPSSSREPFPFVRRLGRIALIGLNSAVPTPLFHAYGRLGPGQLERLGPVLARLGAEGCVRVVLIHHPPLPGQTGVRRGLQDAQALAEVLARHGAELVLHGHNHRAMTTFASGATRPIPVIGVPSASLGSTHGSQTLARYNLYRIAADPEAPIELIERGIVEPGSEVVEIRRIALCASNPALT